ncbi:MAG TPA: DUF4129 domain-containing protein [Spirochaetia bacterium]|nr:DUF4129 domain-containing protein [Spirochaetia bacterium]
MRRKSSHRPEYLAAGTLLGFVLLAAALNGFELADGLRIETNFADTVERAFEMQDRESRSAYDGRLVGWVVSIVVGLSIVLFFVGLLRQENRLSTLFLVVVGAVAVLLLSRIPPPAEELETQLEDGRVPGAGQEAISIGDTLAEEDAVDVGVAPSDAPRFWSWVFAGAALTGLLFVVRPRLPSLRRRSESDEESSLQETARAAVREAEAGGDVLQTVVRCYRDMLELYRQSRYTGRHNALTPRELTAKLVEVGVPREAAEGLTELFERARYGTITLTRDEEAAALGHMRVISGALEADRD